MQNLLMSIPELQPAEMAGINQLIKEMTPEQQQQFIMLYNGKRKKPQEILILTCLGFIGIAGIQRMIIGQVGMGILYLLTCGLCFIGTVVDVINYKSLATDYNLTQMYESGSMVKMI